MIQKAVALLVLVVWMGCLEPAFARDPSDIASVCGLNGTVGSVVVDVYDATTGTLLDTIANGEVARMGSTDCFSVDLATTVAAIAYPAPSSTTEKHYLLQFRDDGSVTIEREETVFGTVGYDRVSDECVKQTAVYPTVPILGRGITAEAISQGKPNYIKFDISCQKAFGTPDYTYYWVFSYDANGRSTIRESSTAPPSP